jgi:hypothetical protein
MPTVPIVLYFDQAGPVTIDAEEIDGLRAGDPLELVAVECP